MMKRLAFALLLLTVVPAVKAQSPTLPQPNSTLANDPVFRQMVTERELLFKKLQDITEFQQFMQVERSIEQYVATHPQAPDPKNATPVKPVTHKPASKK
jgi:hypothetical protein